MKTKLRYLRSFLAVALLLVIDHAGATNVNILIDSHDYCANSNGSAHVSTDNAPGPLTFVWSTGATSQTVTGLAAGIIWVDVVDGQGTAYSDTAEVIGYAQLPFSSYRSFIGASEVYGYVGVPCAGQCNGAVVIPDPQYVNTGPLAYVFDVPVNYLGNESTYGYPVFSGFCDGGTANFTYTDINGCAGSGSFQVDAPFPLPPQVTLWNTTDYCENGVMGSATWQWGGWWFTQTGVTLYRDGNFISSGLSYTGGNGELVLSELLPGHYTASVQVFDPGYNGVLYPYQCGDGSLEFDIYDMGPDCGRVEGNAWYDQNVDCVFDGNEVGMTGNILAVEPGGYNAYVGINGHFAIQLPAGNYSLQQLDPYVDPICPVVQPVPFTVAGNTTTINLANGSTEPMDIVLYMADGAARPGFDQAVQVGVHNPTPQATGPVTLTCTFDANTTVQSANPAPTTTAGNTLTWELPALSYFGEVGVGAHVSVPVSVPLGTLLSHTCSVSNTLPEVDLANNTYTASEVVTSSYDPNDKIARTSTGWSDSQYFIDEDSWIDYTIRFQNTGTDTAFTVVITDTLEAELDMASFEMGASSHPVEVTFRAGRVVKWTFNNILLPDSNVNEAASHGLVSIRIKPVLPLVPGTLISNTANIFFDFNEPVITEPSVLVAELSTGVQRLEKRQLRLQPNPASDQLHVSSDGGIDAVTVLAADGREMMRRSLRSSNTSIDVSALRSGAYVLLATLYNGSTLRERFIKL